MIGQALLNFLHDFGIGLLIACLVAAALWAEALVERKETEALRKHVQKPPRGLKRGVRL